MLLIIDPNIIELDIITESCICDYLLGFNQDMSTISESRVGFIWQNNFRRIPFGDTPYLYQVFTGIPNDVYDKVSVYFTQEFINFITNNNIQIVDLITCNLDNAVFLNELSHIHSTLPNITINYANTPIGNIDNANWVLETSNENMINIYFNDNILKLSYNLDTTLLNTLNSAFSNTVSNPGNGNSYFINNNFPLAYFASPINLTSNLITIDGQGNTITIYTSIFTGPLFTGSIGILKNINIIVIGDIISPSYTYGILIGNDTNSYIVVDNCSCVYNGSIKPRGNFGFIGQVGSNGGYASITNIYAQVNGDMDNGAGAIVSSRSASHGNQALICNNLFCVVNGNIFGNNVGSGGVFGAAIANLGGSVNCFNIACIINGNVSTYAGGVFGGQMGFYQGSVIINNVYCIINGNITTYGGGMFGRGAASYAGGKNIFNMTNAYCAINGTTDSTTNAFIGYGFGENGPYNANLTNCIVVPLNSSSVATGGILSVSISTFTTAYMSMFGSTNTLSFINAIPTTAVTYLFPNFTTVPTIGYNILLSPSPSILYVYKSDNKTIDIFGNSLVKYYNLLNVACYNHDTYILCLINNEDVYCKIQNLKKGDLVKTYRDGYKAVTLIGKKQMINNINNTNNCMYIMKKTNNNNLIADLIVTGNHFVEAYDTIENEDDDMNEHFSKKMIQACNSPLFEKINNNWIYTYYHFVLEKDIKHATNIFYHYCVWANGIISESTTEQDFIQNKFITINNS